MQNEKFINKRNGLLNIIRNYTLTEEAASDTSHSELFTTFFISLFLQFDS